MGAIVVRRGEGLASYRDAGRGDALVLDQVGRGPASGAAIIAAGGIPVLAAGVLALVAPGPGAFLGALALATFGSAAGAGLATQLRGSAQRRATLIVSGGTLRLHRAPDLDRVALELHARDFDRIEVVPRAVDVDGWMLVAVDASWIRHVLLETYDRRAALRVRTLLIERLARDGAFADLAMHAARCPSCDARILMPTAWLPTAIACASCGAEGTLTRG
ncbi:Hypothetical protein I5071_4540 [Sandaracinus amylolyticus]|nr:Hypothetical protein I5071_4540 [Sandaracinus amylolyticus]